MSSSEEALLRLSIFAGLFAALAVAEWLWPRRSLAYGRVRWLANIGLSALNTGLLRLSFLVVPTLGVLAAVWVEGRGVGLLPAAGVTGMAAVVLGFVLLDLVIYGQHVAFHRVPALWRLHRVHHADPDFDVSTAIRFHPIEIVLSQVLKMAAVVSIGVPAVSVLVFEIVLNATSMFSHANVRLPRMVDALLRFLVVTPDMHRVHHSIVMAETNSNFGFNLSLWDRLFGTYRARSRGEQTTMPIGLESFRGAETTQLLWLLRFPFVRGPIA